MLSRALGEDALKIYELAGRKNVSGERIRQAGTALRLSRAGLAARMQVNGVTIEREAVSEIETGDRFAAAYALMVFARVPGAFVEGLVPFDSPGRQET